MLGSIKGLFERAARRAQGDAIAGWARRAGYVHKREKDGDGFAIDGHFDATPWRLEWGRPQRPYIEGHELRMRMVLGVPPELQMLIMTKPLRERLANEAFEQATQSNQTHLNENVSEETRWLVVFPKISMRVSLPFAGGVALLEMPAISTCGIAAIAVRRRAKYSDRSVHVMYEPSCTGIGSDIVFCGS